MPALLKIIMLAGTADRIARAHTAKYVCCVPDTRCSHVKGSADLALRNAFLRQRILTKRYCEFA